VDLPSRHYPGSRYRQFAIIGSWIARTMAVNQPSRRVMEKCGLAFVRGYHFDDVPAIPGAEQGEVEYALTREEWEAGGDV